MRPLISAFSLVLVLSSAGCGIRAPGLLESEDNDSSNGADNSHAWTIEEIQGQASWTEAERQVPVLLARSESTPPVAYLTPFTPPPGDQGAQASGVAWAAGYAAATVAIRRRENGSDYVCSPAFVFNRLNGGQNRGIDLLDTLNLLRIAGCPDQRFMLYRPNDFRQQPDLGAMEDAARRRIRGFARVDFHDEAQIRAHLLQGHVVIALLRVTEDFFKLKSSSWTGPVGDRWFRHAVAVVGFESGRRVFLLQHSGGEGWGRQGRAEISADWFVRLTEKAYVIW